MKVHGIVAGMLLDHYTRIVRTEAPENIDRDRA
jgi:hypothetical protein